MGYLNRKQSPSVVSTGYLGDNNTTVDSYYMPFWALKVNLYLLETIHQKFSIVVCLNQHKHKRTKLHRCPQEANFVSMGMKKKSSKQRMKMNKPRLFEQKSTAFNSYRLKDCFFTIKVWSNSHWPSAYTNLLYILNY